MKIPKNERIEYQCDICANKFKHIDMYDEELCYDCQDEKVGDKKEASE